MNEFIDSLLRDAGKYCKCCLAGGAVRDILLGREPKDYDVFILSDDCDVDNVAVGICDQIGSLSLEYPVGVLKAVIHKGGKCVQLIDAGKRTIDDLMDTFDWNVSLFAYDVEVHSRYNPSFIKTGSELKIQDTWSIHNASNALSTMRRGFRFAERYGMYITNDTLIDLCRLSLDAETVCKVAPAFKDL